ncbi:hypothetical protein ACQP1O_43045 (plasmid) [Nocardia sp. CA-151230]|uniref:hypothetical protein n=1 Tax=Nocardia sp. CA-151230 TaxID=3239982 RepID=UPI003D9458FB
MAKDSRSKASNGGCTWVKLDTFEVEFTELDDSEPVAAGYFEALMDRAEGSGVGEEDYDAPMGLRLTRLNKPWIAEFKTKDRTEKNDIRLYWGEAPVDKPSLVACLVGTKPANVEPRGFLPRQDKHITRAMDRLISWCRRVGEKYRLLQQR